MRRIGGRVWVSGYRMGGEEMVDRMGGELGKMGIVNRREERVDGG